MSTRSSPASSTTCSDLLGVPMPPDLSRAPARRGIVLADGAVPQRAQLDAAWPDWNQHVALVVAADGGVRHAAGLGLQVDRWVGDGDSVAPEDLAALEASGVRVDRVGTAKDESDAELALLAAIEDGATSIVLLGALGGERIDHAISNLGLLRHPALGDRPITIYDEKAARISLLSGDGDDGRGWELSGRVGDLVSLLPVDGDVDGVSTLGLGYPLDDEPLLAGRTRGVSNLRTQEMAIVGVRGGRLLVIETPVTVDR
jgi:thiamine pyrophosphokinase